MAAITAAESMKKKSLSVSCAPFFRFHKNVQHQLSGLILSSASNICEAFMLFVNDMKKNLPSIHREMKNQYFRSLSGFMYPVLCTPTQPALNLCCRMFFPLVSNVSMLEKRRLYCIMLYLKFITRMAKKN